MVLDTELEINGDWPALDGGKLEEMFCSEMWYQNNLYESANVIYIKVDGKWYRLYFDCGIIFWRNDTKGPDEFEIPECESHFKNTDVGRGFELTDEVISSVIGKSLPNGSEVEFKLETGKSVTFSHIEDNTTYIVKQTSPH